MSRVLVGVIGCLILLFVASPASAACWWTGYTWECHYPPVAPGWFGPNHQEREWRREQERREEWRREHHRHWHDHDHDRDWDHWR